MNIHERIKEARTKAGLTLQQLGEQVGVTAQAVQQWEDSENGSVPRSKKIDAIASALSVSPVWLQFGESYTPPAGAIAIQEDVDTRHTHKEIQLYDYKLSAGTGNFVWVTNHKEDPLVFREQWFIAKGLHPDDLRAMYVKGDSMEPEINNWDTVIIDITDIEPVDGYIYAVIFKNQLFIKRIQHTGDGLQLISSNPNYEPIDVTFEESDKFQVLGRMVWRGG